MQRTPVSSTAIQSVGYDPAGLLLEIEFTTGKVYQYRGVPPTTHAGLMGEAHKGHTSTPGSRGTIRNRRCRSEGPLDCELGRCRRRPPGHRADQLVGHDQVVHVDEFMLEERQDGCLAVVRPGLHRHDPFDPRRLHRLDGHLAADGSAADGVQPSF